MKMANQKKTTNNPPKKTNHPSRKKTAGQSNKDFLEMIDDYIEKKMNFLFWTFFAISILFTFLLFDLRISVGGDDSTYILKADDFIKNFKYPAFQGPLYPIVLSPFIALLGINLPVLKLLSALFLACHFYFFYRVFRGKIPSVLLLSTLALIAINPYLLFYGSQTYSEAFLLFAQSLFFLYFYKSFIGKQELGITSKKQVVKYLTLGFILLAMGLIKSLAIGATIAVILYFLIEKKWKPAAFSIAGFAFAYGFWQLIRHLVWGDSKAQFSEQASTLILKHPYDQAQGFETLAGYFQRLLENSNNYLSRQFMKLLGIRPEFIEVNGALGAPDTVWVFTILLYIVFFVGFIWAFKENKLLKFTGIYMGIMMGITFVALQTIWEGHRLIIPFFPFMVLFLSTGIYAILKRNGKNAFQFMLPVLMVILFFYSLQVSTEKIKDHQKLLRAQLRGNLTAGFTPDWVNFINMSIWASENIPAEKVIASRKPSISSIYGNRRFFGIFKVDTENPDSLLNYLYEKNVEYIVMASLRKNEAQNTGEIINTIQRYLYFIQLKYPEKIKLVHQIGETNNEPAFLFKIEK
jgi:hypothetical protein